MFWEHGSVSSYLFDCGSIKLEGNCADLGEF